MRILHVINGFGVGGAEVALLDLLKATSHAIEHAVVSFQESGPMRARFEAAGIPVYHARMSEFLPLNLLGSRLKTTLEGVNPDLVHAHLHRAALVTAVASATAALPQPFVFSIHQSPAYEWAHALTTAIIFANVISSRLAKTVIFVSERSRRAHVKIGYPEEKTVWIPNGYDLARLRFDKDARRRIREEIGVSDDNFVIGHVARVTAEKDHRTLFAAFERVRQYAPKVKLLLVGAGTERLAPPATIASDVIRLGMRADAHQIMSACDLGVSSSAFAEAFPNVLAEFQAIGRMCVTTDVGDSSVIVDKFGKVVPPRNPEAMAAAILDVIRMDPSTRSATGARARAHVEANFSLQRSAERHIDIWAKAVSSIAK